MMHIVTAIAWTIGAVAILVWGLIRVLHDLLERGPYDAPLVQESPRQEGPWSAERDPGRNQCYR
jgi:hypothetical protein